MKRYLWMLVDLNNEELPLAVCDSSAELAKKVGVSPATVRSAIEKSNLHGWRCRYVKVEVEDED